MIKDIRIFGAASEKDGAVGWAVKISCDGFDIFEKDRAANQTSARYEIHSIHRGLIRAGEAHGYGHEVSVYTNNGYVADTIGKGWLEKWVKAKDNTKKHMDLWMEIRDEIKKHDVVRFINISGRFNKNMTEVERFAKEQRFLVSPKSIGYNKDHLPYQEKKYKDEYIGDIPPWLL